LVLYFVANQDNPFYRSANFAKMIRCAQNHPQEMHLRESKGRLSLVCDQVGSIQESINKIAELTGKRAKGDA
jgi:transcription-repair coupling factor (superfamily II helicase)